MGTGVWCDSSALTWTLVVIALHTCVNTLETTELHSLRTVKLPWWQSCCYKGRVTGNQPSSNLERKLRCSQKGILTSRKTSQVGGSIQPAYISSTAFCTDWHLPSSLHNTNNHRCFSSNDCFTLVWSRKSFDIFCYINNLKRNELKLSLQKLIFITGSSRILTVQWNFLPYFAFLWTTSTNRLRGQNFNYYFS